MTTLINLILIHIIVVCIIDLSGFIDSLKYGISYILTKGKMPKTDYSLKPLDCSLCCTFWCCLAFLLVTGSFSLLYLAVSLLLALFAQVTKEFIILLRDIAIGLINKINDIIQ